MYKNSIHSAHDSLKKLKNSISIGSRNPALNAHSPLIFQATNTSYTSLFHLLNINQQAFHLLNTTLRRRQPSVRSNELSQVKQHHNLEAFRQELNLGRQPRFSLPTGPALASQSKLITALNSGIAIRPTRPGPIAKPRNLPRPPPSPPARWLVACKKPPSYPSSLRKSAQ